MDREEENATRFWFQSTNPIHGVSTPQINTNTMNNNHHQNNNNNNNNTNNNNT
jgi:hypothetical protein